MNEGENKELERSTLPSFHDTSKGHAGNPTWPWSNRHEPSYALKSMSTFTVYASTDVVA